MGGVHGSLAPLLAEVVYSDKLADVSTLLKGTWIVEEIAQIFVNVKRRFVLDLRT